MRILELPDLVLRQLLSCMGFADICRLRLTCSALNIAASECLTRVTNFHMQITEDSSSHPSALTFLENLLPALPVTKLHLHNTSEEFYNSVLLQTFAELHGSGIKTLRLNAYFLDSLVQETFLEQLPNIQELKIDNINGLDHRKGYTKSRRPCHILKVPGFFQNLKVLKFGRIYLNAIMDTDFWFAMISSAPRLNYIRYPRLVWNRKMLGVNSDAKYECHKELIDLQRASFTEAEGHWLQFIDFKNLDDEEEPDYDGFEIIEFVQKLSENNVKLLNLHASYLAVVEGMSLPGYAMHYFSCIRSVVEYRSPLTILPVQMEKITIRNFNTIESDPPDLDWDELKSINFHFDKEFIRENNENAGEALEEFMEFLFRTAGRNEAVRELKVTFDIIPDYQVRSRLLRPVHLTNLTALTNLTLVGWNPINRAFPRLWRSFPFLEELWIEDCPSLGNVGFVGENQESPVFLKLKRLVKLTLVLNHMDKISDRTFKNVFSHMALKLFTIKSKTPLQKVTKTGILSLLDGKFARTIEKFPFDSWSLFGVTEDEMLKIKGKFKMLIS